MNLKQLEGLEERLDREWGKRRGLGDYDTNASGIRLALEALLAIILHLKEQEKKRAGGNR